MPSWLLVVSLVTLAHAQSGIHDPTIHLRHHTLHYGSKLGASQSLISFPKYGTEHIWGASEHEHRFNEMMLHHRDEKHSVVAWFIALKVRADPSEREALSSHVKAAGGKVGDVIPPHGFIVYAEALEATREHLMDFPGAVFVTVPHFEYKYSKDLKEGRRGRQTINVIVNLHEELVGVYGGLEGIRRLWAGYLKEFSKDETDLRVIQRPGHSSLFFRGIRRKQIQALLENIAPHPAVLSIEERSPAILQNKFSRYIIQTDRPGRRDLWDVGLEGNGETIAVSDTGMDVDNCWFRDPLDDPIGINHRKIAYYNSAQGGDGKDRRGGHGSHVVGSLLGNAYFPQDPDLEKKASNFNGMAPNARVAFFDYDGPRHSFDVPEDLYHDYYRKSRRMANATMTSNSWGTDPVGYDGMSHELDSFVYDNPDFLAVMAAGNYGSRGHYSLSSPGNAKNCLTIGATKSSPEAFSSWGNPTGIRINDKSYVIDNLPGFRHFAASRRLKNVPAKVWKDCSLKDLTPCSHIDCVLFVKHNDSCTAQEILDKAKFLDIPMVIFEGFKGVLVEAPWKVYLDIGAGMLPSEIFDDVWKEAEKKGTNVTAPVVTTSPRKVETVVPGFSSKGPTRDGRNKPDVLAPGDKTQSVHSDGSITSMNCGEVQLMTGTSMATPIAAGGAALVRQYFREGWYPSGKKDINSTLNRHPSAALIKAVIINGAESVDPDFSYNIKGKIEHLTTIPSTVQGFGRMKLDSSVYLFQNQSGLKGTPLYALDAKDLQHGRSDKICLTVNTEKPVYVSVTLVWTDPPASHITGRQLVNNLDLLVHDMKTNKTRFGNSKRHTDGSQTGDSSGLHDDLNNVEQVAYVAKKGLSDIAIKVHAKSLKKGGSQAYGLAVSVRSPEKGVALSGEFTLEKLGSCKTGCPNNCSSIGSCSHSGCKCPPRYGGVDCSLTGKNLTELFQNNTYNTTINVPQGSWKYFLFEYKSKTGISGSDPDGKKANAAKVEILHPSRTSDPDLYINKGDIPTHSSYHWKETTCDSCKGKQSKPVYMNNLNEGVYWIGVNAACCIDSTLGLRVTIGDENELKPMEDINDNKGKIDKTDQKKDVQKQPHYLLVIELATGILVALGVLGIGGYFTVCCLKKLRGNFYAQVVAESEEVDIDEGVSLPEIPPISQDEDATAAPEVS